MAAPSPVTDAERVEILRLHGEQLSRNEICRRTGRSNRTVSEIVAAAGGTFVRGPGVIAGTEARKIDAAAKRSQLMLDLLDDAARLRQQLWEPALVFSFGGRDNHYAEHQLAKPAFADQAKIMTAVATAIDKAIRLEEHERNLGDNSERGMLTELFSALREAREARRAAMVAAAKEAETKTSDG